MRPDASKRLAAAAPKQGPNAAVIGAVIAAVIIVVVVVVIVIGNKGTSAGGSGSSAPPAGVIGGKAGGILAYSAADSSAPTASSNAPTAKTKAPAAKTNVPTLELWEDFQCPGCAGLEKSTGAQMASMAKAGEIKLVVHMLSFLDRNLGNDSSARSANAASCASDAGKFLEYHAAVFAAQPAREGEGYTDAQLTEFAKTAGITGPALTTWQKCTSSGQYAKYVASVQEGMAKAKVQSTPTVRLNGQDISPTPEKPLTSADLVALVKAATK